MNCPKCGSSLSDGATFCPNCGSMLGGAPASQSPFQPQPDYQKQSRPGFQQQSQSQSPFQQQSQSQSPFQQPQTGFQQQSKSPFEQQPQSQSPFQQQPQTGFQQQPQSPFPQQSQPRPDFQQQSQTQSPFQQQPQTGFQPQSHSPFQSQPQSPFQQQSQSPFQQQPQPDFQSSGSSYYNYPAPKKKSKKPLIIGIAAGVVALIAIVLLVIFVVLPAFNGGSEGEKGGAPVTNEQEAGNVHDSVDSVIDEMNDSTDKLIAGEFSADAYDEWLDAFGDLAPEDAREAFIEDVADDTSIEEFGAALEYMDLELVFDQGEELSSSELDDINDELADAGSSAEATSGYYVSLELTATLLEDMNGYDAGETQSETRDEGDLYIIEVDGSWYLWY